MKGQNPECMQIFDLHGKEQTMQLETLTKALADQTRLRIMMLILAQGELCVCDLTDALEMSQPKISRHLAILRDANLLQTRKKRLWVFYNLHEQLPVWAIDALENLLLGSQQELLYQQDTKRLKRPCC